MTSKDLIAKYGPPGAVYEAKYCRVWNIQNDFPWFPAAKIFINSDFKNMLYQSFVAIWALGLNDEIKVFSGCLCERPVRGSNSVSAHWYACAIDLNASDDPMYIVKAGEIPTPEERLGTWSQSFVNAMTSSGIFFGGNFQIRPDPMHFSMADM